MVVKGKKLTFKEYLQKVKSEFKGMTFRQKLEHFWAYYKWILVVLAATIFVVMVIISAIQSLNTQLRLAGALINVDMTADGFLMLQDGYAERIGLQEDTEIISIHNMQFKDPYTTMDQTYALNVHEGVLALAADQTLDYLMFDDVALSFFLDPELLLDLRELFSQQALDAMGAAVIWLQMADTEEKIPVAIEISDTAFYRQHVVGNKPIYLAFTCNSPRTEVCKDLWQYLKGGSTDTLQTHIAGTVVDATVTEEGLDKLTDGFFAAQSCVEGDHRVELTQQSFLQPEGQEEVKANVQASLQTGKLDYVIASMQALEEISALLDLRQVLTEQELAALEGSMVYEQDVPVAVKLSATAFGQHCEGEAYLAFSANTQRTEQCKALWAFVNP